MSRRPLSFFTVSFLVLSPVAITVAQVIPSCATSASAPCHATAQLRDGLAPGSDSLQEANHFPEPHGGGVTLTTAWSGSAAATAAASGSSTVRPEDQRQGPQVWFSWAGNAHLPTPEISGRPGPLTAPNTEGVRYADQFPGTDIGARANAAIAALPSGCGTVVIPVGTHPFATTIVKPRCVLLEGEGAGYNAEGLLAGTVLQWTPQSGVALAIGDSAGTAAYPAGGIADLTLLGPGAATTTFGLWLGGDPAGAVLPAIDFAESQAIRGVRISGFGTGVEWGNNAWVERFYDDEIFANGVGINAASGAANTAEQNVFIADDIFNNAGGAVAANEDFHFIGTSFDFNGTPSVGADYTDCHFEQSSGPFLTGENATIIGGSAYLDAPTGSDTAMFQASGATLGEWQIAGLQVGSNHPVSEVLNWSLPPNSKLFISDLRGNGGGGIQSVTNAPYMYGSYVNAELYQNWAKPVEVGATLDAGAGEFRNSAQGGNWNIEMYDDTAKDPAPHKFLRVHGGAFQIANSAFNKTILSLDDGGALAWGGGPGLASSAKTGTGNLVLANSPRLTGTPALPPAYTVGGNSIAQPTSSGTLALTSQLPLKGATASIGGSALSPGQCTDGTAAVAGANSGEPVVATPQTYPGDGVYWEGYVGSDGMVTVKVCAIIAVKPASSVYRVRVLP